MVGRPRLVLAALALVLPAALLISCGGSDNEPDGAAATPVAPTGGELAIRASEWRFEPPAIVLTQGEQVRFVLQNDGEILHDLKIRDLAVDSVSSNSSGPLEAKEGEAFVSADSGNSGTLDFVPSQPGTYEFYCTIGNHEGLGMHGTITVQPASE
ncbi:MAG: plastocyanin/azurin family copper-binding protein [Dehalococcoidia bacterium]